MKIEEIAYELKNKEIESFDSQLKFATFDITLNKKKVMTTNKQDGYGTGR